jgi:translocation and assembly module TamA
VQPAHAGAFAHGAILLCVLAACGGRSPPAQRPGEDVIGAIEFEGNEAISDGDLRRGLALRRAQRVGGAPDPFLVVVDGDRVRGEYLRRGYLEVDVRSRVERRGDTTRVIYTIQEGPRATTRVRITGIADPALLREVRAALPLAEGDPFSYEAYDDAKDLLLGLVEDAGYAHAQLDAQVVADRERREAVIHLDYRLGPLSRFGDISIIGVPAELERAVRARLSFAPGDLYSVSAITETQRRIYALQRFSTVRILPDKTRGDRIGVRISLAASARNELGLGGGLGVDPAMFQIRGRTTYSIVGWPFTLTDTTVDLRPAYAMLRESNDYVPRVRAMARVRRLDLFRTYVTGEVEGGYNYLTVEAYTSYGPRARLGVQTPLWTDALQLRVGWEIERLDFREVTPLIDPMLAQSLGLDQSQRIGQFTQAVSYDLRDHPIEPRLGAFAELRLDEGTPYAGGALSFVRVTPELRGYVPLPWLPIVVAARVRGGAIYGEIPMTERYFSGGSTMHRGFGERRLAPTLVGPVEGEMRAIPIGGGALVETSVEARARLGRIRGVRVGAVVFLDGGDVTEAESQIELANLHWAAGAGVRAFTPIGPVRLDLGYRLNRRGAGEPEPDSRFALHLSIGEAF